MAVRAEHPGTCPACDTRYSEGTLIIWRSPRTGAAQGWGHEVCPDPLAMDHPPCPDCFLVHPAGGCDR